MLGRIRRRRDAPDVIDIRDSSPLWFEEQDPDVAARERARLIELQRARREAERRRLAAAELERLRRWHWDPQRLLDEARSRREWWELPDADPYAILEILPGATLAEANAARRRIAHQCHPDVLVSEGSLDPEDERSRRMRAANDAYDRIRRVLAPN